MLLFGKCYWLCSGKRGLNVVGCWFYWGLTPLKSYMAVGDAHVFSGILTPVLTHFFFPKPLTTFLTCFCKSERRKYTGKKVCLNWGSNSKPPGHESDMLTAEPPRRSKTNNYYGSIKPVLSSNALNHHVELFFDLQENLFNLLSDDKILKWSKLRQMADDILKWI